MSAQLAFFSASTDTLQIPSQVSNVPSIVLLGKLPDNDGELGPTIRIQLRPRGYHPPRYVDIVYDEMTVQQRQTFMLRQISIATDTHFFQTGLALDSGRTAVSVPSFTFWPSKAALTATVLLEKYEPRECFSEAHAELFLSQDDRTCKACASETPSLSCLHKQRCCLCLPGRAVRGPILMGRFEASVAPLGLLG